MTFKDATSDQHLLTCFKKGDHSAFGPLLDRYKNQLFSFLCRMVNDHTAAEDLFQECILKTLKALPAYSEKGKFSSWLFSIANNIAVDYLRKKKRWDGLISSYDDLELDLSQFRANKEITPEDYVNKRERETMIKNAIEKLPVEQKQVLLLKEYGCLSLKEISKLTDSPLNTVKGRMRYALLNLGKIITDETGGKPNHVL